MSGWDLGKLLFPKRSIEREVEDEIAFHIEGRISDLVEAGWDEDDAREHALARFGDPERVTRSCAYYQRQRLEAKGWRMRMENWIRDTRFALRSMARNRGFSVVVVTTLALGVGATTSVFSVVESILLRPLPFPDPDRLAVVWQNDRATGTVRERASTADFYDYVDRSETFAGLAMYGTGTGVLTGQDSDPQRLFVAGVTSNLHDVLGVRMQLGRPFTPDEASPDGPAAVALSDALWRNRFGGDPSVIGTTVTIGGTSRTVVGVLPPGIDFPTRDTDVWTPLQTSRATAIRQTHNVTVVGRLDPAATLADAQSEMSRIMAQLEDEYPDANTNRGAFVERLSDVGRGDLRLTLWVLFGAVLAVMAIALGNVANLMLARGAARAREVAVLTALGADARELSRRFLVEGLLVAALACVGGLVLTELGIRALMAMAPGDLLTLGTPQINATVLAFALAASVVVGLLFGLLPTLQARRLELVSELKEARTPEGGGGKLRVRRFLVALQLAMAVVLLVSASLLIQTLSNLRAIDPGFSPDGVLRVNFALPQARYPSDFSTYPDWPEIHQFNRSFIERVEALPGVESATIALNHPLDPGFTNSFQIEGQPYDPSQGEMTTRLVMPSYFETVGLRVVQGRALEDTDDAASELAIVINRTAAARYFPEGGAVGQRIAFWGPTFRQVVGIVEDERIHGLTSDSPPTMYASMLQAPPRGGTVTLLVRAAVRPESLVPGIRRVVAELDPDVPIYGITTMDETLLEAVARERFASLVLSVFAGVAVFLALLGVHGVLAYLVAQRRHEVGVRMALGATKSNVVGLIVRQGAIMTALGLIGGVVAALAATRVFQGLLFGVSPTSPWAFGSVVVLLGVVAVAATAIPARRAAALSPVTSLRAE